MVRCPSSAFHQMAVRGSAALTTHQGSPVQAPRHSFAMTTVSMNMEAERIRFFAVAFALVCPAVVKRRMLKARSCGEGRIFHQTARLAIDVFQRGQRSRRGWNRDT